MSLQKPGAALKTLFRRPLLVASYLTWVILQAYTVPSVGRRRVEVVATKISRTLYLITFHIEVSKKHASQVKHLAKISKPCNSRALRGHVGACGRCAV
ncbi:hypothetical protein BU25DRAFT_110518 [Macroventuria anomochaeta]|uniref:Uncharacterized protein n=1 Tax=Macroventuria anomochaeta TaxID=301207 RepID=A0ACB6RUL9_9PLEO|nr:uncharacterized protein BU25DRAFT_110518 [Macroventuria anomochaeta]KAF2625746.1 hypothetical protein BU25DRAFT_110518 [Macroventuria anomochaeta]